MDQVLPMLAIAAGCFVMGSIPFGVLLGKCAGVDIREEGSGNIGATNVWRTCGPLLGVICFLLDFLKGLLPVLTAILVAQRLDLAAKHFVPLMAPLACVAGHVWTPWLWFKGGKGIATSAGAVVFVAPIPLGIAVVVWGLTLAIGRYMSVASIAAAAALGIAGFVEWQLRPEADQGLPILVLVVTLAVVAIYRHKANMARLWAGEEPRFGFGDGAADEVEPGASVGLAPAAEPIEEDDDVPVAELTDEDDGSQ